MSDKQTGDEAMKSIAWFKRICDTRNEERDRCYHVIYGALVNEERPDVVEALKSVALQIIDPRK